MESPRWHVCTTAAEVRQRAVEWIAAAAAEAIAARSVFRVVLAGGETPRGVYENLRDIATDWRVWQIWFGDERCLAEGDPLRNSRMAQEALLDHVPVQPAQVYPIHGERGAEQAAADYRADLQGAPEFDLVLLGLGEDGHTASLFPSGDWGEEPGAPDVLPVHGAPKLPAERVSLSVRRLANTRCALFLVTGAGKRGAVRAWRTGSTMPAAAILPPAGADVLVERVCIES